jgi:hypothetical protein
MISTRSGCTSASGVRRRAGAPATRAERALRSTRPHSDHPITRSPRRRGRRRGEGRRWHPARRARRGGGRRAAAHPQLLQGECARAAGARAPVRVRWPNRAGSRAPGCRQAARPADRRLQAPPGVPPGAGRGERPSARASRADARAQTAAAPNAGAGLHARHPAGDVLLAQVGRASLSRAVGLQGALSRHTHLPRLNGPLPPAGTRSARRTASRRRWTSRARATGSASSAAGWRWAGGLGRCRRCRRHGNSGGVLRGR